MLDKPVEVNDSMDIRLEPDVVSGNDVLTVKDSEQILRLPDSLFAARGF